MQSALPNMLKPSGVLKMDDLWIVLAAPLVAYFLMIAVVIFSPMFKGGKS